jgi:hypothetical protein
MRIGLSVLALVPTLGLLVGAGCKDVYVDAYPDIASFCAEKANEECAVAANRCVVPGDRCVAARIAVCKDDASHATAMGRAYTSSFAQTCLDATRALFGDATLAPFQLATRDDACSHVFQGAGQKGATCSIAYDCAGANICDKGRCAPRVEKMLGDGCANPGEVCTGGSYCGASMGLTVCIPAKQAGQGCSAVEPCDENLHCSGGVCAPRVGIGQPCTMSDDCASSAPYCDPAAQNRCDTGITLAPGAIACQDYGAPHT